MNGHIITDSHFLSYRKLYIIYKLFLVTNSLFNTLLNDIEKFR